MLRLFFTGICDTFCDTADWKPARCWHNKSLLLFPWRDQRERAIWARGFDMFESETKPYIVGLYCMVWLSAEPRVNVKHVVKNQINIV